LPTKFPIRYVLLFFRRSPQNSLLIINTISSFAQHSGRTECLFTSKRGWLHTAS
jgi:hypothetical protein